MIPSNAQRFLKSALINKNSNGTSEDILKWVINQKSKVGVSIQRRPISKLDSWEFLPSTLRHDSGKFFSIDGLRVRTKLDTFREWEQPIINQPEIGYLGFITKEIDGVLNFLLQAKIEPGNINYVQLSPTLQATKSNYTQIHKGKQPNYLDKFRSVSSRNILIDQLQSEQGARFLKKRNRNIIIEVQEQLEVKDNFIWATLGQIKDLMRFDNVVNMDTRTVISGIPFEERSSIDDNVFIGDDLSKLGMEWLKSYNCIEDSFFSFQEIISKITGYKCNYELSIEKIDLNSINNWVITKQDIYHIDQKFFRVIGAEITIENREVSKWCQPLVQPAQDGLCAFVCKKINGVMHFIVQAKLECGNFDVIEFAPTVQCLTGNFQNKLSRTSIPFLDLVLNSKSENRLFDSYQSEEGGRFYKEQNRNIILEIEEDQEIELPERYLWMTLSQIQRFIQFNNYINIQARSLIASITFIDND